MRKRTALAAIALFATVTSARSAMTQSECDALGEAYFATADALIASPRPESAEDLKDQLAYYTLIFPMLRRLIDNGCSVHKPEATYNYFMWTSLHDRWRTLSLTWTLEHLRKLDPSAPELNPTLYP